MFKKLHHQQEFLIIFNNLNQLNNIWMSHSRPYRPYFLLQNFVKLSFNLHTFAVFSPYVFLFLPQSSFAKFFDCNFLLGL
jgi:hypothetical protein